MIEVPHQPDYSARRHRVRQLLKDAQIEAFLVTGRLNVRYLTGFTGSQSALLLSASDSPGTEDCTIVSTDGRYTLQVRDQVPDLISEISRNSACHLAARAKDFGVQQLGYESHIVTVEDLDSLANAAGEVVMRRLPSLIESAREIKDEY
ncbi:MAG: aminopeptidase P family N-terminal domain-containing protein, partial [Mycobacteriaceae bacterium]